MALALGCPCPGSPGGACSQLPLEAHSGLGHPLPRSAGSHAVGSSATPNIPDSNDIVDQNINLLHWCRYQEGKSPHCLLYFVFTTSKPVVESGTPSGKYHAYEGSGRTFGPTLASMALALGCPCPGSPGGACSQLPLEAHSGEPVKYHPNQVRMLSVTKQTGYSAGITCDIPLKSTNYDHWAPHCILYFSFTGSNVVVEAGITSGKYYAFEGSGRTCKLVVRNVQESDAAVDYCAACESQVGGMSSILAFRGPNGVDRTSPLPLHGTDVLGWQGPGTYLATMLCCPMATSLGRFAHR
ncbi:T cell receptor gamma variable 8 [Galemys pyrenaicus]|nr:T cell receptor gamma variable 8 [Galemys pyrenaicus]